MHLYHLTLQRPTAILSVISGCFSGLKHRTEFLVVKTSLLQIWTVEEDKLRLLFYTECFGVIRAAKTFRLAAIQKDFILCSSDSGKVVVLEYHVQSNRLLKVQQETFGKSGCRRVIPGQLLACDFKARAFMIAATQRQKLVYRINREGTALKLGSPLQFSKDNVISLSLINLRSSSQCCLFAALEMDYGDWTHKDSAVCKGGIRKALSIYEFDIGLNHVVKKSEAEMPAEATGLLQVLSQPEGPGGLIILCEGFIVYKMQGKASKKCYLPVPLQRPSDRKLMIISQVLVKTKEISFYLILDQLGNLLQIKLNTVAAEVIGLTVEFFDYVGLASALALTKEGHLLVAGERQNHKLYKIIGVGGQERGLCDWRQSEPSVYKGGMQLLNLRQVDQLQNMSAITDIKIQDLAGQNIPQIVVTCSQGDKSSIKVMKEGLKVIELGGTTLDAKPLEIFSIGQPCNRIVLSYVSQTVVLGVMEDGIRTVVDHGFQTGSSTILVAQLSGGHIIQVLSFGFRLIKSKLSKWETGGKVKRACTNGVQLAIALEGGDLIYFEMKNDQLVQIQSCSLDSQVKCMDICKPSPGRARFDFIALGLMDHTVRIISLMQGDALRKVSIQQLDVLAQSVALLEMQADQNKFVNQIYLFVGSNNGKLVRLTLDPTTGSLNDQRNRQLGLKPVKIVKCSTMGISSILCLSTRLWLIYPFLGKNNIHSINMASQDSAACFPLQNIEGFACLSQKSLKFIKIDKYGEVLNSESNRLSLAPKKILFLAKKLYVLEGQHRASHRFSRTADRSQWASSIKCLDPKAGWRLRQDLELNENEVGVSCMCLQIKQRKFILVSTVSNLTLYPKQQFKESRIRCYEVGSEGLLELLHITEVEDLVLAMAPWNDKVLAGVGCSLRAYQMGMKKLLKKAELKGLSSPLNSIFVSAGRIFTSELADSFHVYKYHAKEQTFIQIADDILPRWTTATCLLDHHTVAGADKFQTFFVSRVPQHAQQNYENNPNSYKFRWENGVLNGAYNKLQQVCSFYVGDIITAMVKTSIGVTSAEVIVYATISGALGVFYPFQKKEDLDFFVHLQLNMRSLNPPLLGRDHLAYRSYYSVCRNVVDGDLCEQVGQLAEEQRQQLTESLQITSQEVLNRLDEIRHKIM